MKKLPAVTNFEAMQPNSADVSQPPFHNAEFAPVGMRCGPLETLTAAAPERGDWISLSVDKNRPFWTTQPWLVDHPFRTTTLTYQKLCDTRKVELIIAEYAFTTSELFKSDDGRVTYTKVCDRKNIYDLILAKALSDADVNPEQDAVTAYQIWADSLQLSTTSAIVDLKWDMAEWDADQYYQAITRRQLRGLIDNLSPGTDRLKEIYAGFISGDLHKWNYWLGEIHCSASNEHIPWGLTLDISSTVVRPIIVNVDIPEHLKLIKALTLMLEYMY